jgi:transcriptional regulator with XRE-family HTH domain
MTQKVARPGAALKAFRERKGWTLAEVSRRTGLTISTLSKVENGRVSLNFEKLSRLSTGLGLDIGNLLSPDGVPPAAQIPAGRRNTTRSGEETVYQTEVYNHLHHATDLLNKMFTPMIVEPRARSVEEFGELIRHSGEEFVYVLEGVAELHTDTYAPLTLHPGDSIYFDSGMAHAFIAVGEGRCRILSVSSAPEPNSGVMKTPVMKTPVMRPAKAAGLTEASAAPAPRRLVRRA